MNLDTSAEAELMWLPKGVTPTAPDFRYDVIEPPPGPNTEGRWTLEDAAMHAAEVMRDHDKVPWIKTGDRILGPSEIAQVCSGLRAMRMFDAKRA
jgi:hypothetical protein